MDVGFSNVIESTRQYFQGVPVGGAVTPRQPAASTWPPHYPPVSSAPSPLPYPTPNITSNRLPSIGTLSGHRSGKGSPMEVFGRSYSKYAGDQPALYHPSAVTSPPAALQPSPNLLQASGISLSAHLPSHLQSHQTSASHLQTSLHSSSLLQSTHSSLLQSSHHSSSGLLQTAHHPSTHLQASHPQSSHHSSNLLQNSLHSSHNSTSNLLQSSLNSSASLLQSSHNSSSNHLPSSLHASSNHHPSSMHNATNHLQSSHHTSNHLPSSHHSSSSSSLIQQTHHSNHLQHTPHSLSSSSMLHSNHLQASHHPSALLQSSHHSAMLQATHSSSHHPTSHHSLNQHHQSSHHSSSHPQTSHHSSTHAQASHHSSTHVQASHHSSTHSQASHHSSANSHLQTLHSSATPHHPTQHNSATPHLHHSSSHSQSSLHSSSSHSQSSHHHTSSSSHLPTSHHASMLPNHMNSSLLHGSHPSSTPMMQANHSQGSLQASLSNTLLQQGLLSGHAQALYPPGSLYYKSGLSSSSLGSLNAKLMAGHLSSSSHHQVPTISRPPSQSHQYLKSPGPGSSSVPRQSPLPQYVPHQPRSSSSQSYPSQAAAAAAAQTAQESRKGKRESPLDLSVKTVRQSADSTAPEPHVPRADLTGSFSAALRRLPPIASFRPPPARPPDPPPPPSADSGGKRPRVNEAWRQTIDRQIEQKLSSYLSSRSEVREAPAGQKVLNLLRTSLETRRPRPPPVVDLSNDDEPPPPELDGLAAFLAARIRTKAELKQVDSEKQQLLQQAIANPTPHFPPQPLATSTPKAVIKSENDSSITKGKESCAVTPSRRVDASSVFDFRESDDESPGPQRQPVIHHTAPPMHVHPPLNSLPPQISVKEEEFEKSVKAEPSEEDEEWTRVCEELAAELARVVETGRAVPRRRNRAPNRALHMPRRRIKKEKDSKEKEPTPTPSEEIIEVPWLRKPFLAADVAEGPSPDFPPGWQDEMYRYKQSLRMPDCLISVPRPTSCSSLPDLQRYRDSPITHSPTSAPIAKSDKSTLDRLMDRFCSHSIANAASSGGRSQSSPRPKPSDENPYLGYLTIRPPPKKHSVKEVFGDERASSAPPSPRLKRQKSRPRAVLRSLFLRADPLRRRINIPIKRKRPRDPSTQGDAPKKIKLKKKKTKTVPKTDAEIQAEMKTWVLNKNTGETVLHRAAKLGYTEVMRYLLVRVGYSAGLADNSGYTALHEAASRGHVDVAKLLVEAGADPDRPASGGIRPLHEAAQSGLAEVVSALLAAGADAAAATENGATPLEMARQAAAPAAVALLEAALRHPPTPVPLRSLLRRSVKDEAVAEDVGRLDGIDDFEIEECEDELPWLWRLPGERPPAAAWVLISDLPPAVLARLTHMKCRTVPAADFERDARGRALGQPPPQLSGPAKLLPWTAEVREAMEVTATLVPR